MQIDGHHTLTYVVARFAGISHHNAEIVAYSAQYVDEATNDKPIFFDNGAMFDRIVSAHKMLDYRNTQELANHLVWIPFHFLPGNQGLPWDITPDGSFIHRLVCKPDSYVARDMLHMVATHWDKPFAAHLMGIAMHVYADTFAHQGFAGVIHDYNIVNELDSSSTSTLEGIKDRLMSQGISSASPLGHGAALSFPDRPYASWSYINGEGLPVKRNNTAIYLDAANAMCKVLQCWNSGDTQINVDEQPGLTSEQYSIIEQTFLELDDDDGHARHAKWIKKLQQGSFGFEPVNLSFDKDGSNSWKVIARGHGSIEDDKVVYHYTDDFLHSDWKKFHDALKTYRLELIRDILPRYGICVA
ncbi:hypothetical protein DC365_20670 [Vibrio vulnificus]|uniref:Uncharacterized protein n=4 Tax=Vibrio TaxID=662 RepID=A0AA47JMF8_VIBPH|nr:MULTISPECIES: DUF6765 family protein [Vibrio]MBE3699138.1 hypothetical protein [Vibrio parahaemolyticus]MBE3779023.1 hypothetical protein [Vibrio parahaemolyticus]MBE4418150.1 hypothetical protein [Vibrio parahaemolyticus]MBE4475581.1 hypothetical protein [Vibrio parahaemolyticus]MBN8083244.1 hypothetical protein [Vibrio vulnificus]